MKNLLLVVSFIVAAALADPAPSITLDTIIRDFTPQTSPDFEAYLGDDRGVVSLTLDADGKPSFRAGAVPTKFTSLQTFQQWYRDTPNVNIRINSQITLDLVAGSNPAIYSYNNQEYFPIDNQGFGNYENYGHNFHFTTEIHTVFTYQGGEVFTFIGDDDVFVYINNNLAIDLGGVHGPETLSVSLDQVAASLGITTGNNYHLDVFQAERHTVGSTFRMDTTIQLVSVPPNPSNPGSTVYICGVRFDGYCAGIPADQCPSSPNFASFAGSKKDTLPADTSFDNFNVVSFGDFNADTGDVQGRLAVAGDLTVGDGYSVGALVNNQGAGATDIVCPYSLVVGGNASFGSGRIMPDGLTSDNGYNSAPEGVFVGGTFNAPSYLQSQVTGQCVTADCLGADFANAQAYYATVSDGLTAVTPNTQTSFDDGHGLTITCADSSAATNYITLTASAFSSILSYNTPTNCNPNSAYVFNIVANGDGTSAVTVQGDGQHFTDPSNVLYNFPTPTSKRSVLAPNPLRSISTPNGGLNGAFLGPHCNLAAGTGVNTGITIAGNIANSRQFNKPDCPPPSTPPTPPNDDHLCPYFETDCAGLQFPLGDTVASFRDFNVISFNNFVANTGDVEGRVAVRNNMNVGNGYSVGYQIQTGNGQDNFVPYAVVVGGDCNFGSGAVYPEGNNIPYPGAEEDLFVGGTFTGEADLAARVLGSCHGNAGCLNQYFDLAHNCYANFQAGLAAQPNTVSVEVQWSALQLTCSDNAATEYTVTLTPEELNAATYYVLNNCNLGAKWTINVGGTGDVTFAGDSFPGNAGGVVYNVLGSGRTINVQTQLNGNLLAPDNTLDQTGGVIEGKVVVGDVTFSLQINKPDCPHPTSVTVNGNSAVNSQGTSHFAMQNGQSSFANGDSLTIGGNNGQYTIVNINNNIFTLDNPLASGTPAGTRVYTVVLNPGVARGTTPASAGSSLQVIYALVALLVALLI